MRRYVANKTVETLKSALSMYTFLDLAKMGAQDSRIAVEPIDLMKELDALLVCILA